MRGGCAALGRMTEICRFVAAGSRSDTNRRRSDKMFARSLGTAQRSTRAGRRVVDRSWHEQPRRGFRVLSGGVRPQRSGNHGC